MRPARTKRSKTTPAPTPEEVREGLSVVLAIEDGPWGRIELMGRVREQMSALATDEAIDAAVSSACAAGEIVEGLDGSMRKPIEPELTTGIARVLGEAHRALAPDEIHAALLKSGLRAPAARLLGALDYMVAEGHVEAWLGGGPTRYLTAHQAPGNETASETEEEEEAPSPAPVSVPVPPLMPTVAELLPTAPRKARRIREPLSVESRLAFEARRAEGQAVLDRLIAEVRAQTRAINLDSRVLRDGHTVRVVEVAIVPDYARRLLVMLDTTGPSPVEVESRPLPRRYGMPPTEQMGLSFGGAATVRADVAPPVGSREGRGL